MVSRPGWRVLIYPAARPSCDVSRLDWDWTACLHQHASAHVDLCIRLAPLSAPTFARGTQPPLRPEPSPVTVEGRGAICALAS